MTHKKEKIISFLQIKILLFICLFLGNTLLLPAQSPQGNYLQENISQRNFDKKQWKEITSDIDYSGVPQKLEEEKQDTTDTFGDFEPISIPSGGGSPFGALLFKIFAIFSAISIVVFIVYSLLNGGVFAPQNSKVKRKEITLENIEGNIHETELEGYIKEAKAKGDYRLAMRLYYLAIIKELSLKKLIKWKRDKTNGEYLHETKETIFFHLFKETTTIFENVWYGEGVINETEFNSIEPTFRNLVDAVAKFEKA